MTSLSVAIGLSLSIITVLVGASCSSATSSSGDLDTRTGCAVVTASPTTVGSQVVMDVRATGCRAPDGSPLSHDDAADRLVQAMWHSLRLPVDAIHVRALDPADARYDTATVVTSEELKARFGPGPPGVVWPGPERGADDGIWFLLPVAYLVGGLGMVWFVRRAGVVVVFFRT